MEKKEKSQNYDKENNDIIEKIKKAETLFFKNDNKEQVGGVLYFFKTYSKVLQSSLCSNGTKVGI